MSDEAFQERLDAYLVDCLAMIDKHGWMLQGVFATADHPGPPFTYTVGLSRYAHPELIIFGLAHQVAGVLLNDMGGQVRGGRRYAAGQVLDDLVKDLPVHLLQVRDTSEHLTLARRLYGASVPALQVVWPDTKARFPWDAGYDINPDIQPLLGEEPHRA